MHWKADCTMRRYIEEIRLFIHFSDYLYYSELEATEVYSDKHWMRGGDTLLANQVQSTVEVYVYGAHTHSYGQ